MRKLAKQPPPDPTKPVLVYRPGPGLGDFILQRMLFRQLKEKYGRVWFACPPQFFEVMRDLDSIERLVDSNDIKSKKIPKSDFRHFFDISDCCRHHELYAGYHLALNRADVWAHQCCLILKEHDTELTVSQAELQRGKELIGTGQVAIVPRATNTLRSLEGLTLSNLIQQVRGLGLEPYIIHSEPVQADCKTVTTSSYRELFGVVAASPAVCSVDTGVLHVSGALGVNTLAIFRPLTNPYTTCRYYPSVIIAENIQRDVERFLVGSSYCPSADITTSRRSVHISTPRAITTS